MGSELTVPSRYTALSIGTNDGLARMEKIARTMAQSGAFKDAKQASQAFAKLVIGEELGVGPAAAMSQIFLFDGKVTFGASLIASQVKNSGRYRYRVTEASAARCEIHWSEFLDDAWTEVGVSEFTIEEAKVAGLLGKDNWRKYPSDMLFARTLTRGARRYCPDMFGGGSVYTPEEVGGDVDEDGNLIIDERPAAAQVDDIPAQDPTAAVSWLDEAKRAIVEARDHFGNELADKIIGQAVREEFGKPFAELSEVELEALVDGVRGLVENRNPDGSVKEGEPEDAVYEEITGDDPVEGTGHAYKVTGSRGAEYDVVVYPDGTWDCSCPARTDDCKHVKELRRPYLSEDGTASGWLWPGDVGYDSAPPSDGVTSEKVERTLKRAESSPAASVDEVEADGAPDAGAGPIVEFLEMGREQGLTDVEVMNALAVAEVASNEALSSPTGRLLARGRISQAAAVKRGDRVMPPEDTGRPHDA